jgi:hypothetical protein
VKRIRRTGRGDDLWLVVRRTIGGQTRRTIERLATRWDHGAGLGPGASRHLDSWVLYEGPPTASLSGLAHLAGEPVAVLADGFVVDGLTVAGDGTLTLPRAAATVVVGLAYDSELELLVPDSGGGDGPSSGKLQRNREMVLTLVESGQIFETSDGTVWRRHDERAAALPVTEPVPLLSGAVRVPCELGWKRLPVLRIRTRSPLPFTLASILRRGDVSE